MKRIHKSISGPGVVRKYTYPRKKTVFQKTTLKIGEVSEETGVPIVTLRFYQQEKLIKPIKSPDKKTTHRRFAPNVITEIELIKICRAAGFSIPEMRSIMKLLRGFKPPAKLLMNFIYRTVDSIRHQMRNLEEIERILILRMGSPEEDIEKLINEDEEIWRLRRLKPKA